jgi:hypothetical protein
MAWMFLDFESQHPVRYGLFVGLGCAALIFSPVGSDLIHGHEIASYMRQMAPEVQSVLTQKFDALHSDDHADLTDADLALALANMPLSENERAVLTLARSELSEIGHVTGSYTTYITTTVMAGKVPITTTTPVTMHTYGINRDDLAMYPERVQKKYELW